MSNELLSEKQYSVTEADEILQESKLEEISKYSLFDTILLLLFADKEIPIDGKVKQQKEIFLAFKEVFSKIPNFKQVDFDKKRYGPFSEEVDHTIDDMGFSNHIMIEGKKKPNTMSISITQKGITYIKEKFAELPPEIKQELKRKRANWDSMSTQGIMNYVYLHYPEYRENAIQRKRFKPLDWNQKNKDVT